MRVMSTQSETDIGLVVSSPDALIVDLHLKRNYGRDFVRLAPQRIIFVLREETIFVRCHSMLHCTLLIFVKSLNSILSPICNSNVHPARPVIILHHQGCSSEVAENLPENWVLILSVPDMGSPKRPERYAPTPVTPSAVHVSST
eukprot:scaffold2284_cov402-Prasinococcus_capsulatus_cf.AAC.10